MRTESEIRKMRSEILAGAVGVSEDAFASAVIAAGVLAWVAGDQATMQPFGDSAPANDAPYLGNVIDEIETVIAGWRECGNAAASMRDIESILGPKAAGEERR